MRVPLHSVVRSLWARIILAVVGLTVTFGIVTATFVINQWRLEDFTRLIRRGYGPLTLQSKDLARRSDDLKAYLEEAFDNETNIQTASANLKNTRQWRDRNLATIQRTFAEFKKISPDNRRHQRIQRYLDTLQLGVESLKPHYDAMENALAHGEPLKSDAVIHELAPVRDGERRLFNEATELSVYLENNVLGDGLESLEANNHKARLITIYLGLTAVILALLVTTWVVWALRPLGRLRDAARRVAAGEYGHRIQERGPSEVADLARELNSMGRAVEDRERELVRSERLAAVGKMAAMITHEVRNPLSSIGLNTELLEEELEGSTEEAKKLLHAIHREVDRLTAITEEYLAFARLPKPKLAHEAINPMVGALAAFVREDLAAKQVKLLVELGDSDPIALVDAAQLRQCLINLVRNATEALSAKGGGTVTLRTRRAGDRIVIEVEDNGIGIAPDVLPRMFDPFFSTKEGGSGLGLALTQQIVKDHGGDLAVQSTVGKGTTFTVSVPAKPA